MKFILTILCAMLASQILAADNTLDLQNIPLKDINGKDTSLKAYSGKVVLLVNVASKCGYTPQYTGLEALYKKYQDKGLVIIGVPSNDFGGQEPGTAQEIVTFCRSKYSVTFPLMEKVHVVDSADGKKCPLYVALTGSSSPFPGEVKWNFQKFVIDRDGKVAARFESKVKPDSPALTKAVEAALAKN